MAELIMPIFETAQERTDFIRDNATYYTIAWRQDYQNKVFRYTDLQYAREQAKFAANHLRRPVMLYAVWHPELLDNDFGYDSWIENVKPD
jgi:hypothetical protein